MAGSEVVGKAIYTLEADATKVKKGTAEAEALIKKSGKTAEDAFGKQATGALDKFDAKLQKISKSGGLTGAIMGGVGIGAGLGIFSAVSAGISSVMDTVGRSIDLASDKAEAASKANVLFGDSYTIVKDASEDAAESVAMSSGAYLDAAGNIGNMLKNMGIAGDAAADMSVDMIKLASDVGSFNNADPTEVIEAMGSAFRGEADPIERFGVFLSAAKVQAKAMAMGLKQGKGALTDQAKAMATYQIILDSTTAAQGDFARTAEGKANADRIRAAKTEEAFTRLGEVLLPLYQEAMPLLADATIAVIDALTSLGTAVAPLVDGALQVISGAIKTVSDAMDALHNSLDPGGDEWNKVTKDIVDQADALGLDSDAVLAWIKAEKERAAADKKFREERARAEQDEARRLEDLARVNQRIADTRASAKADTDKYVAAIEAAKGAEDEATQTAFYNNLILERKLQLNTQLVSDLNERDRLTNTVAGAERGLTRDMTESERIHGLASDGVVAYQKHIEDLAEAEAAATITAGGLVRSGEESAEVFSRTASAANLAFGSVLLAAVNAQKGVKKVLDPEEPDSPAGLIRRNVADMFQTTAEMKAPWIAAWKNIADWVKDPFRSKAFQHFIANRIRDEMKEARDKANPKAMRRRAQEVADALKSPILKALVDLGLELDEAIARIIELQALGRKIEPNAVVVTGAGHSGGYWTTNKKGKRVWVPERAAGGPVSAGTAYMVGERGPEMFVPRTSGTIVPNAGTASSLDVRHTITLEGARNLRAAGYDSAGVAALLRDGANQAHHSFEQSATVN